MSDMISDKAAQVFANDLLSDFQLEARPQNILSEVRPIIDYSSSVDDGSFTLSPLDNETLVNFNSPGAKKVQDLYLGAADVMGINHLDSLVDNIGELMPSDHLAEEGVVDIGLGDYANRVGRLLTLQAVDPTRKNKQGVDQEQAVLSDVFLGITRLQQKEKLNQGSPYGVLSEGFDPIGDKIYGLHRINAEGIEASAKAIAHTYFNNPSEFDPANIQSHIDGINHKLDDTFSDRVLNYIAEKVIAPYLSTEFIDKHLELPFVAESIIPNGSLHGPFEPVDFNVDYGEF